MASSKYLPYKVEKLDLLCEWGDCKERFERPNHFLSHINCHINEPTDSLQCRWKSCEAFTYSKEELECHHLYHAYHTRLKCHGDNLIKRRNLPQCTFDSLSRNSIPSPRDLMFCQWKDCEEIYKSPEIFHRHVDLHSDSMNEEKKFQCLWIDSNESECNRVLNDAHKLKEHLRSHTHEKMLACPTCGGMFSSRTAFLDHLCRQMTESSEDMYPCGYCNKMLPTERLLKDHMRHHISHYKCPHCDMTCPNPSTLQNHIIYRHSVDKPFKCEKCDHCCKNKADLKKHENQMHTQEILYKCPITECNYQCRNSKSFSKHFNINHEGGTSSIYMCHMCSKTYSRGNYLTQHLTKNHKLKWPAGHCRFRYRKDQDGIFRLQTVRYESLELSEITFAEDPSASSNSCDNQEEEAIDDPIVAPPNKKRKLEQSKTDSTLMLTISSKDSEILVLDDGSSVIVNKKK